MRTLSSPSMIPQSFIQDLLARVDIADVVGRYVQLKKAGQNLLGLCPFHGEKSPSFTVSPSKQFFHCFGCGAHGSAIGFLMEHRGLGYVDAIRELAQMPACRCRRTRRAPARRNRRRAASSELLSLAAEFYRKQLKTSAVGRRLPEGTRPDRADRCALRARLRAGCMAAAARGLRQLRRPASRGSGPRDRPTKASGTTGSAAGSCSRSAIRAGQVIGFGARIWARASRSI